MNFLAFPLVDEEFGTITRAGRSVGYTLARHVVVIEPENVLERVQDDWIVDADSLVL